MRWLSQLCIAALFSVGTTAQAFEIAGPARVVDGDTLEVGDRKVRFLGVDAPEGAQTCRDARGRVWDCGDAATNRLMHLTQGGVRCRGTEHDRYDRLVAVCFTRRGRNINAILVREGYAWAYRRYSRRFVRDEDTARRLGIGIWAAPNVAPWDYRRAKRAPVETADASPPGCAIKGNVSGAGRVYHVPGTAAYARTRIDVRKGERWFCSESQARAAGWRPPRG